MWVCNVRSRVYEAEWVTLAAATVAITTVARMTVLVACGLLVDGGAGDVRLSDLRICIVACI